MADIRIEGLSKAFGGAEVLKGLDLSIRSQEFLVVLGASGCGKSTLLRLIAGLETPDAGRIRIDGDPVEHLQPGDRGCAMVFQNYALSAPLSSHSRTMTWRVCTKRRSVVRSWKRSYPPPRNRIWTYDPHGRLGRAHPSGTHVPRANRQHAVARGPSPVGGWLPGNG
ncbi:MAG: hypothetical protein CML66_06625 [Rhodobacteraceae bacterium]|nr:hypothetical protein [Paracoccaceae bacterium]MAY45009.1 hypothetical protein [Paracoccaceae bacterium]